MDLGFKVYIDISDPSLSPKTPNKDTGERLCDVIEKSTCIFYIHSQQSENSKWCPWELGYADGNDTKIVVLEIVDDESSYKQEYLELYPFLKYLPIENTTDYRFWVHDRNNKSLFVELSEYIKGQEPYEHV